MHKIKQKTYKMTIKWYKRTHIRFPSGTNYIQTDVTKQNGKVFGTRMGPEIGLDGSKWSLGVLGWA